MPIGNLGSVAFDIVAKDRTSEGLEKARKKFVVTAGDIVNSIRDVANEIAKFDEVNSKVNTNLGITALTLGMNKEELRGWAGELTSATDGFEEASGLIDQMARAGLQTKQEVIETAKAFDTFADAVGVSSDQFAANMIPVLKAFNIDIRDVGDHADYLAYTMNATGVSTDEFSRAMVRLAPQLNEAGISIEEASLLLVMMKEHGYQSRTMMSELSAATSEASDVNKDGVVSFEEMVAALGITSAEQERARAQMSRLTDGYAEQAAKIRNDNKPIQDKYNTTIENTIVGLGAITGPLTAASSLFGNFASTISTLAVPAMVLFPGKFAALTAAIEGGLSSIAGSVSSAATAVGGSIAASVVGGAVLGLAGVWTLDKLGILKGLSDLGNQIKASPIGSVIMDALKVVLAPIGSIGAAIIDTVRGDFAKIPEDMVKPFEQAGEAAQRNVDRIKTAFSGIGGAATSGVQSLGNAVQSMVNSFSGMGSIGGYASAAFSGIGSAFSGMAGQVRGVFSQMVSAIQNVISSTASGFYAAGHNMITWMVNGILAAADGIIRAIGSVLDKVHAMISFRSPAKEGPLSEEIDWAAYLTSGMEKAAPAVAEAASTNLAAPVAAAVGSAPGPAAAGGGGGGGGGTVNIAAGAIVINGAGKNSEEIAQEVIKQLSQQMSSTRKARGLIA